MSDDQYSSVGGDSRVSADLLFPLVYEELRQLARKSSAQTAQATALVHESRGRINTATATATAAAKRDWVDARAWMLKRIEEGGAAFPSAE